LEVFPLGWNGTQPPPNSVNPWVFLALFPKGFLWKEGLKKRVQNLGTQLGIEEKLIGFLMGMPIDEVYPQTPRERD